jgi:hypothetical protein
MNVGCMITNGGPHPHEMPDTFGPTLYIRFPGGRSGKTQNATISAFLLDRLRTIFTAVAPETVPLRNSRGQVMYLLCFACGNPRGAELAVRIARSVIRKRRR